MLMNLLIPFRRDAKRDLAHGSGKDLLASKIRQVLGTEGTTPYSSGELFWRTDFGAAVDRLRHQNNDAVLVELAKVHIRDALERWVPEVELVDVEAVSEGATLHLRIRYRTTPQEQDEVTIPIQE
ncbi:MAG: GPW/gp25 family protein [Deltaproteobacteria bacterium]|nr:GPW/gp25 family protein [Deltaproteobacteria bacterium]